MPISRTETREIISTQDLAMFYGVDVSHINRRIKNDIRYDLVHIVLYTSDLTDSEKRTWLNGTSLSEYYKRTFWEKYLESKH